VPFGRKGEKKDDVVIELRTRQKELFL